MGSGVSGLAISGLGFQPSFVMIKATTTAGVAVFKTSAMPAANTAFTSATADNTATQITFTSGGFTLGTLANVNSANVMYNYIAFTGSDCTSTGNYCVGTYTGTGAATLAVTTGFQPSLVMVKRSTAVSGHYRQASEPTNETLFMDTTTRNTTGANIQSMSATGFTVGATDNASAGIFYYIAFKTTTGSFKEGTYAGNATDNRSVTGVGFVPNFALTKNATSVTAANQNSLINFSDSNGDNSGALGVATANIVDGIQALQNDGFQIGAGVRANETGQTFYYFAFGGETADTTSGTFTMAKGSYTGTGVSGLAVTGLAFSPNLVIVKADTAILGVFRTSDMKGDSTSHMGSATANFKLGIISLNADGFTVGTSTFTNTASTVYRYEAYGNAFNSYTNTGASDFAVGTYYGNGLDTRNITRLPWQPNMVAIKRSGASLGVFRTSAQTGDVTSHFSATADIADNVQSLNSDGFQVGTSAQVNTAANIYYWFAFKTGSNFTVNTYTATGSAGNITTVGFQPDNLWVKRTTAVAGVQRSSSLTGDATQYFAATANATLRITAFVSTGFSLGASSTETNASGGVYWYVAWKIPSAGTLSVDVVDSGGTSVASPSAAFGSMPLSFNCSSSSGSLGVSSQKIRVNNDTANGAWSVSIAATSGATGRWANAGLTSFYDFNDASGSPAGCADGADADAYIGQLSLNPSVATVTPEVGCSNTNTTLGSSSSFVQGSTDSLTLISANSSAQTNCYWELTGITASQKVPAEQPVGSYTINMTITVVAV